MSADTPIALVTGASSGIGRACALRLARAGFRVVALARTQSALDALVAEGGGAIVAYAVDAADGDAVFAVRDRVVADVGVVDVVVHSAGLGVWKYLEDTTPAEIATMLGAPFLAAAHVTAAFLPVMISRKRGRIFHIGSPASIQPWAGSTAYATSRWALRGLHEALRIDLAGTGVSSTHVLFGEVTSSYFSNNPGSHEHIPTVGRFIPTLSPEQCADVVVRAATSTSTPPAALYAPFMLRVFMWTQVLFPGLFRAVVVRTGRKRSA